MLKYFEKMIKKESEYIITEKVLKKLKGKSTYSEYQEGDIILYFLEQKIIKSETSSNTDVPAFEFMYSIETVVQRDFDKVKNDYVYIRMAEHMPVLEMKNNKKEKVK